MGARPSRQYFGMDADLVVFATHPGPFVGFGL
jgi:hypothetical protein